MYTLRDGVNTPTQSMHTLTDRWTDGEHAHIDCTDSMHRLADGQKGMHILTQSKHRLTDGQIAMDRLRACTHWHCVHGYLPNCKSVLALTLKWTDRKHAHTDPEHAQTDRWTDRHAHSDRWIDRHAHTDTEHAHTDRWTDRHAHMWTQACTQALMHAHTHTHTSWGTDRYSKTYRHCEMNYHTNSGTQTHTPTTHYSHTHRVTQILWNAWLTQSFALPEYINFVRLYGDFPELTLAPIMSGCLVCIISGWHAHQAVNKNK